MMPYYDGVCGKCKSEIDRCTGICLKCGWSFERDMKDNPQNYTTGGKPLVRQFTASDLMEIKLALWNSVFQRYESLKANGIKKVSINEVLSDYRKCCDCS